MRVTRPDRDPPVDSGTSSESPRVDRRVVAAIVAVGIVVYALYGVLGPGFVLDDWYTLRNAEFDGAWAASGVDQRSARPGAWIVYALVFGVIGRQAHVVLLVQAVMGIATAVLLYSLVLRLATPLIATLTALLWLVLPNHTSLEVWASATNIALATLLVVWGAWLLASPRSGGARQAAAIGALVASALCYEAVIPLAALVVVVVPWLTRGRPDWRVVLWGGAGLTAAAAWIVANWHPAKDVAREVADLGQMVGAHVGWGIAPEGMVSDLLTLVAVVGVAIATGRLAMRSTRSTCDAAEWSVVAGLVVIVTGTLPFAFYLYAPLGAGDRFNFVSAIGGALLWAGLAAMVWRVRPALAWVGIGVLLAVGSVARVDRAVIWHHAGEDADAILAAAVEEIPDPDGTIVFGPKPIQQANVAAFLDPSNVRAAVQLAYDDPEADATLTYSEAEWDRSTPALRVDIRPVSQLDPDD
jgi:hypothetical protein